MSMTDTKRFSILLAALLLVVSCDRVWKRPIGSFDRL